MQNMFTRILVVSAIATVAAFCADNSIGTWKINIEKSKYTPAPWPVKNLTAVREAAPGGVKVTSSGEQTDGTAINFSYTAKFDGSPATVEGNAPYDSIAVKQVNANTFTYTAKNSKTKYRASGRTVISSDGKTMTTRAKGTNPDGKPMTLLLVYDKQ